MFGVLTKHFKDKVVDRAVHDLATTGQTGLDGIGRLKYDYINKQLTIFADPKLLKRINKEWEESHRGVAHEV